jgi:hypothetical protein
MSDLQNDEPDIKDSSILQLTKFVVGTVLREALHNQENGYSTDFTDLAEGGDYPSPDSNNAYYILYDYEGESWANLFHDGKRL